MVVLGIAQPPHDATFNGFKVVNSCLLRMVVISATGMGVRVVVTIGATGAGRAGFTAGATGLFLTPFCISLREYIIGIPDKSGEPSNARTRNKNR